METVQETGLEGFVSDRYLAGLEDPERIAAIREELDTDGVCCLEGFLREGALSALQAQVLELEKRAVRSDKDGNRKYSVKGEMLAGTIVDSFVKSEVLLKAANAIMRPGTPSRDHLSEPIRSEEIRCGLNIMRGPGDVTQFHFDDTALNILIPVFLPDIVGPNRGQLKIYPNIRSFRRTLWDRFIIPAICRIKPMRRLFKSQEVHYKLGNVYVFYGYRCLHGVESPSAAGLRCITNVGIAGRRTF